MPVEEKEINPLPILAGSWRNVSCAKEVCGDLSISQLRRSLCSVSKPKGIWEIHRFMLRFISPEPSPQAKLPVPTIEEIIYSDEFIQTRGAQQQLDCLVRKAKITKANVLLISQITVGQRDNPAWHLARRGRHTASNFGSVLFTFLLAYVSWIGKY